MFVGLSASPHRRWIISSHMGNEREASAFGRFFSVFTVGILVNFDAFGWFSGCISYLGAQLTLRVKL